MLRTHHREAGLPQAFQILDTQDQLAAVKRLLQGAERRRGPLPAARAAVVHQRRRRTRACARADVHGDRRAWRARRSSSTPPTTSSASAKAWSISPSCCCAAYELLSRNEILREHYAAALPPRAGRRVPGHQPAAVPLAEAARRAAIRVFAVGDDDQSHLRLPRRQRRQHGRLRARLQGRARDPPGAELPLARQHPRRRQRADRQQPQPPGQEPVDRRRRRASRCACSRASPTTRRRAGSSRRCSRWRATACAAAHRRCSTAPTRSRGWSSTRCSRRASPYRVYGGLRFFERAEIKHALAYLRLHRQPDDDNAFLRVVNFPPRGIGARTMEQLQDARAAATASSLLSRRCSGHCGASRRGIRRS